MVQGRQRVAVSLHLDTHLGQVVAGLGSANKVLDGLMDGFRRLARIAPVLLQEGLVRTRLVCLLLEYRLYDLVDNLVEVFLFDVAKATLDVTFDVTSDNLALHEAGLREGEAVDHVVTQRIRILWIEPVVGSDEHKTEHAVLVLLQLVVTDDDCGMGLECTVGEKEANLYDVSLVVLHR